MSVMRLIGPAVICAAVAAPVSADVTLRMTMVESEIDGRLTNVTEYRKGLRCGRIPQAMRLPATR